MTVAMPEGQGTKDPQPPADTKQSQGDGLSSPTFVPNTSPGGDVSISGVSSVRIIPIFIRLSFA